MVARRTGSLPPHQPVLYHEIIELLQPQPGGRYIDGTLGAGGHAWGILESSSPSGLLLGMDLDPIALQLAGDRLAEFGSRVVVIQASYDNLDDEVSKLGWESVDGVMLDLGVSSMQLDNENRGFSFKGGAKLDMRFNPENPITAEKLVNQLSEAELADILYRFGEERNSRAIARAIVKARPIQDAKHLAALIGELRQFRTAGRTARRKRIHPATRTFQALRIAVNKELVSLENALPRAVASLSSGGRLAVIAYHSLEDRIVKRFFRRESRDCLCPAQQPVCTCDHRATIIELTRRPIRPVEAEVQINPRARSARLRAAEKI